MNKLSVSQELRITNAAERMVDLANGGMSPDDALYKVSMDESLTPDFVRRLGEVYNTSRMLHHFHTSPAEKRADDFPLAVPANVLSRMYPEKPEAETTKAASCHSTWFTPPPDFCEQPLEKSASAPVELKPSHDGEDLNILIKRAQNHADSLLRSSQVARSDEQYCREMVRNAVVKAAQHFCTLSHTPFAAVETDILTQYGSEAKPLMDAVFFGCRGEKMGEKRGSASETQRLFDSETDPYHSIVSAFRLSQDWHKAAMESTSLEEEHKAFRQGLDQRLQKLAGPRRPRIPFPFEDIAKRASLPQIASATFIGDKLHGMMQGDKNAPQAFEQKVQQAVDPEQETQIRSAQTKAMLHEMMTNDPAISGHDPSSVLEAFNEISRMTPRVAEQPAMLRGLLRRRLEMGATEPFEASQVIDAETGLKKIEEPSY